MREAQVSAGNGGGAQHAAGAVTGGVGGRGLRRVAVLSVHTCPEEPPGTGDAGGMNVYVDQTSRRLAQRGVLVDVFTRATTALEEPSVEVAPGVTVHHVQAGPFERLPKEDLPAQLCAFVAGVLRAEAVLPPRSYDLVHSHYWLSGQVGWLVAERWGVPLVHTAHTLAAVKNASLADDDRPEPRARVLGEEQVAAEATRLVANTRAEAVELVDVVGADPARVAVVPPGVDLEAFTPGDARTARVRLGLDPGAAVVVFVGRLQPLKAPDLLVRAVARLRQDDPVLARRLQVLVVGGPSGAGGTSPESLRLLAEGLGVADVVSVRPPVGREDLIDVYRAADVVAVPSHSESFGLVAVEAQACGTPVVAAAVGGLPTAVADGRSGLLVRGHDPADWADALGRVLREPGLAALLAASGPAHARRFDWERTVDGLVEVYAAAAAQGRDLRGLRAAVAA